MRLRTANEIMLRRLEGMQSLAPDRSPHTFVFKATEYPCSIAREKAGLIASFAGEDQQITFSLIVRIEALNGAAAPAAGHTVILPDIRNQEYRVLSASLAPDGSHVTLDLGEPLNS